jgi:probable HAF family extracellular repeat protein
MHAIEVARNLNARRIRFLRPIVMVLGFSLAASAWGQTSSIVKGPHAPPNSSMAAADTPASAQYRFIPISTPQSTYAVADGINNAGLVTGFYIDSNSNYHGFVWQNGVLETVDYPGALDTRLNGVSNRGVAIGYYGDGFTNHAVTYTVSTGTWTALPDIPNYSLNEGYCINSAGFAIGNAASGNSMVAWIWDPKARSYSFFAVPGATPSTTSPSCINDKNQIAGQFADSSGLHGFLKEYGTYATINFPGAADTFLEGINNWGTIQGSIIDIPGAMDGFAASPAGVFTEVNYPGAAATSIMGINDRGDLCGGAGTINFATSQAFVALVKR